MALSLASIGSILDGLFGLDGLGFGDPGVRLEMTRVVPAWGWALVVLGAVVLAAWSYRRLAGPTWARAGLATARALTLVILAVLASGPRLVRPNERIERDWVIVLVDRSASLTIEDVPSGAGRISRDAQLRAALTRAKPELAAMVRQRHVLWLGFGGGAFELPGLGAPDGSDAPALGEASQRRTALGASLDQALRRTSGQRISGVVVISDGRSIDAPGRAALRRLEAQQIRVVTVALGSDEPIADLAIHTVDAPDEAFARDPVPIRVLVDRLGSGRGAGGEVRLVDLDTGAVLDRAPIDAGEPGRVEVALTAMPGPIDPDERARWRVELVPAGVDLVASNNASDAIEMTIRDRPLRVVYFDGYPRWEYQYLKNLLLRERTIVSSAMVLAANRHSVQEGDVPLLAVPRSPEEWAPFDVVILGDVRAGVFSERQREQLVEQVAARGGGVLMIAGPGAMPASYRSTAMGDLLPFRAPPDASEVGVWDGSVTTLPSPLARRLGVLRLGEPGAAVDEQLRVSDPASGWSQLRWAQRIDPTLLKPTAEVLAWAVPVDAAQVEARPGDGGLGVPASATPLVITMRYGAGRVVYVATDEIWRWRYGRGEDLPERFWIPLIRMLARQSVGRSGAAAALEISPTTALVDQPVRLVVRLIDQSLVDADAGSLRVRIEPTDPQHASEGIDLGLARDPAADGSSVVAYGGTWRLGEPGRYRVRVVDPLVATLGLAGEVRVLVEDDEMRQPETDHAALAALASAGDGRGVMLTPDRLGEVPALLPLREVRLETPPEIATLWDRPIVLIVVLVLLAVEWMGRRLISLA